VESLAEFLRFVTLYLSFRQVVDVEQVAQPFPPLYDGLFLVGREQSPSGGKDKRHSLPRSYSLLCSLPLHETLTAAISYYPDEAPRLSFLTPAPTILTAEERYSWQSAPVNFHGRFFFQNSYLVGE